MPTLRPFLVVLLKNFYLRKRQWCVSFCEFLLPPILTGLLLLVTTPIVSFCGIPSPTEILHTNITGSGSARTLATTSGVFHEQCASNRFLSYTPSNTDVKTIVEEAIKNMCQSQAKLGIMSFDNEDKLENYILAKGGPGDLVGSVVLTTDFLNQVIHYKIRLPEIFYSEVDASSRYYETIAHLQLAINEALLKKLTGRVSRISLVPFGGLAKSIGQERSLRQLVATRKPFPRKYNYGPRGGMTVAIFAVTFGSMFMIPSITRNVIGEKNTGIKELLRMTGVSLCAQYMGWLIHVLLPIAVSTVLIVILLLTPMKALFAVTDEDIPWLVGLLHSNIFLCWLILFVYGLAAAAQVFFICSILRNTTIATSVALLLWVISIFLGIIGYVRTLIPGGLKLLFSVFPNSALFFIFADIDYLECMGPGLTFKNAWQIRINRISFTANTGWYINILFADFIAYNALAVYLDLVLPTEHGIARPFWLFNCKRKQKLSEIRERERLIGEAECGKLDREENPSFERNPPGAVIAVRIINLVKSFGLKVSVDNLSLRMFSGDIFALLGHNGAGKTTTISMLTGLLEPTSGTAILNGHDIRYERDKARSIMGFCPQHNMLFERLTVMQQLKLFGMIRGLSIVQAGDQARNLLWRLHIFDKANVEVWKLSGGHKRMVSLGLAIIGGTRLIFLDEPTSTMDPQARRAVWDLLLELRVQRTMLLTTHSMEEADVLGDRIGIMAFGKLQCCGSASFLKKFYGSGYTLKFTLDWRKSREEETPSSAEITTRPEAENLLAVIQNHIPDASSKQLSNMEIRPNTAAFLLPAETATTMALSSMFQELDQVKQNEGHQYKAISLKVTTLDEVFLK